VHLDRGAIIYASLKRREISPGLGIGEGGLVDRVGGKIAIILDFAIVFRSNANDSETSLMLRYVAAKVIIYGTQEDKRVLIIQFRFVQAIEPAST
jgi:hypothetical protein